MEEKRKHTRLQIKVDTEIVLPDGLVLKSKIINISFGGAFVCLSSVPGVSPGDQFTLNLRLNTVTIQIKCIAVRIVENGLAVQLISIDIDSYGHFKNLMALNSPDPDILFDELEEHPGLLKDGE
ncbi:MAG: PilZ domain-containing protein [Desulfobacterales bacterium]|nr:PilZ domain-containing protein [Desulfobacterales bacterium]